jgi:hypothetical protein
LYQSVNKKYWTYQSRTLRIAGREG